MIILLVLAGVLAVLLYAVVLGPLSGKKSTTIEVVQEETTTAERSATKPQTAANELSQKPAKQADKKNGDSGKEEKPLPGLDEVELLIGQALAGLEGTYAIAQRTRRDIFGTGQHTGEPEPGPDGDDEKLEPDLSFLLSAIIWDPKQPIAIINGRAVLVGDYVGTGIRVMKIDPTSVSLTFHWAGKTEVVKLPLKPR